MRETETETDLSSVLRLPLADSLYKIQLKPLHSQHTNKSERRTFSLLHHSAAAAPLPNLMQAQRWTFIRTAVPCLKTAASAFVRFYPPGHRSVLSWIISPGGNQEDKELNIRRYQGKFSFDPF